MRCLPLAATVACGLFAAPPATLAADMRIETTVYAKDIEEPVSESVTLFSGGVVYHFQPANARVTIFRPGVAGQPSRFVLLDTNRQLRTEIDVDQLAATMNKLRRWSAVQSDPYLQFTGAPQFDESYDEATGELRLSSDHLNYRVATEPLENRDSGQPLRGFLDHFAQLHTLLEAGLCPEPRLRVNEALFRRGLMPLEVKLFLGAPPEDDQLPDLRAEHLAAWALSKQDRSRINEAMDQLASFRLAPNAEFQQGRKPSGSAVGE